MALFLLIGLYLVFLMAIGYAVNRLLVPVFGRWWRLFVAPGVILHELAHVLGCAVTGAHVLEINVWKPTGGHVIHSQPRFHIIGPVLIALAPMLVMTIALFVSFPLLADQFSFLPWTDHVPATLLEGISGFGTSLVTMVRQLDWRSATPWLFLYLLLNIAVTIAPSRIDLHNARWPLVGLIILASLFGYLLRFEVPIAVLWPPIATSLTLLSFTLFVALAIRIMVSLVKRQLPV